MKMTKRIFAMVMAVMLIVALVPFTVSAATPAASFTVKCDTQGFTFEVYQIAKVDTETGLYTAVAEDAGIKAAVEGSTQDLLAACNDAESGWGDLKLTYNSGAEATVSGKAGVFYIKNTGKPATVKSVSNSIVVTPQYKNNAWVDLTDVVDISSKATAGDVSVSKAIDGTDKLYTTAAVNGEVKFVLTASVVGSKDQKLKAYTIKDTHDKSLEYKGIESVVVTGGEGEDITLAEGTDFVVNDTDGGFDVELKATDKALNNNAFYSKANVVVTYKAKLTADAKIGNPGNKNHDALTWTAADGTVGNKDGNDVFVYTFKIEINKQDKDTKAPLQGVTFAVYATENDAKTGKNAIAENLVTDDKGQVEVKGVNVGTYYVKETATIGGYNLNTAISQVTIAPTFNTDNSLASVTNGTVSVTVYNTKSKLPQTGMEGTMMFTFVGAGLILIAGVLFVVAMKKKSVK